MRIKRKAPRYKFGTTCTMHTFRGDAGTSAVIEGISTSGCELRHPAGPKPGEKCELYFEWKGNYIGLEARVVWKDGQGRMGLAFQEVDKEIRGRLEELCATLGAQLQSSEATKEPSVSNPVPIPAKIHKLPHPATLPGAEFQPPSKKAIEWKRRQLPRYECELHGQLLNAVTGAAANVKLVDISISGALVGGPNLPEMGQACELQTEWEGRQLSVAGAVTWKTKNQVGIRFAALDEHNERLLKRICANSRLLPPAPSPG